MSYAGTTLAVSFADSALNFSKNQDALPASALVEGSRNVNIHEGGISSRGGATVIDTLGSGIVSGLFDYPAPNGNFLMRYVSGAIYKNATQTIATGLGNTPLVSWAVMNKKLYVAIASVTPKTWNGTDATTSNLGSLSADWTGTNFPRKFKVHGSGNSERLWACGCSTNKYDVYYSKDNDGIVDADFSAGGQIYIETGDSTGIVGLFEYNDRLWAVGLHQIYLIDDADADPTKWSYSQAPWKGGALYDKLIIVTPNDVIAMAEDGEIYSVLATQTAQDYVSASLTRASFMHTWIRDHVNLPKMSVFHGIYDPNLRAARIFVKATDGATSICDTCLLYFIDRPIDKAWVIHDGLNNPTASGIYAASSALIRVSAGVYKVYTGDFTGSVWSLENDTYTDNGSGYWQGIVTPEIACGNPRIKKFFDAGRLTIKDSICTLVVETYLDGTLDSTQSLVVNTATSGTVYDFPIGAEGTRISFKIYSQAAGDYFFLSSLMLDFVNLGAGV